MYTGEFFSGEFSKGEMFTDIYGRIQGNFPRWKPSWGSFPWENYSSSRKLNSLVK